MGLLVGAPYICEHLNAIELNLLINNKGEIALSEKSECSRCCCIFVYKKIVGRGSLKDSMVLFLIFLKSTAKSKPATKYWRAAKYSPSMNFKKFQLVSTEYRVHTPDSFKFQHH